MKTKRTTKHDSLSEGVRFPAEPDLSLRAEITKLRERITELENERDEFARQNAELLILQQVFSAINSTLDVDEILAMLLRAVCSAVECSRAVLFGLNEKGRIVRRLQTNTDGSVKPGIVDDYQAGSTLEEVAAGQLLLAHGTDADPDKPLKDTKGSYCIAPLRWRNTIHGLLYVDDFGKALDENRMRILLDFAGQAAIALENARLYEELRRALEETQQLALTDVLTELPNRRAMTELLERELHTAHRYQSPFAFVMLDLDDLKDRNDRFGHAEGDRALKRMGEVLRFNARKGDIIARYAGDEFVIVMTRAGRDAARIAVERLQRALRADGLRVSIGISMFPEHGYDAQSLFYAADKALYEAKQSGKDTYRFHGGVPVSAG